MILHRNERFRDRRTADLITEAECWLHDLAELETDLADDPESWDYPQESRAFMLMAIDDLNAELNRRQRIRQRPEAPPWPARRQNRRAEIDDIRTRLDLATLIERQCLVHFKWSGSQLWCRCPLPGHDDGTPSFAVHPAKQVFYCHGCHRGGDVFTFMMHALGTDRFSDVLPILKAEAGIELQPARAVQHA